MRFDAGTYYVGDLCYVLGDRWDEFLELTIKTSSEGVECIDGGFVMKDGTRFWTHGTMYGDGSYHDNEGRKYAVDAGLIGVVSIDQIDKKPSWLEGGQVIKFDRGFEPYYNEGRFHFGYLTIDTSGNDVYDYDYDEDEEEAY